MLTEPTIREALRDCYATPPGHQKPVNIVDLGLIESIALAPDLEAPGAGIPGVPQKSRLALTLLALTPDEDVQTQLRAQIANRLAGLPELSTAEIHFAEAPIWTPGRISPDARRLLQLDFPILNNRIR